MKTRKNISIRPVADRYARLAAMLLWMGLSLPSHGQEQTDTTAVDDEHRNQQNVLLNASSATQPRFISLGIPQWGTAIMEDGLPTALTTDYFPGFWVWRGGLATESMQLTGLDESALMLGNIGYYPMSTSKVDATHFEGEATFGVNHYGRIETDINLAIPLGKRWSLDLNAYQDLDRGSNHLDMSYLQQHIQYYKAGASKVFDRGRLFATYLYTKDFYVTDQYGPFIFVGDGSVKQYGDFDLGKDQYLPSTSTYEYVDVKTGQKETNSYVEDGGIPAHVATVGGQYRLPSGISLDLTSRLKMTHCNLTESNLSSIELDNTHYTLLDGTLYTDPVQTRYMVYNKDKVNEWFTTANAKGGRGRLEWNAGANAWVQWNQEHVMTTNFAHEATKDPQHLLYDGEMYYVPNTGAQFVEGHQTKLAGFGLLKWMPWQSLSLRGGLRLEYSGIHGTGSYNRDGETNNDRCAGWNLTMPGVTETPFHRNNLNGAASLVANYRFNAHWGLELDAVAAQQHAELWQFGEASLPTDEPKRNYLVRGGVNFRNSWLDFQSLLMYYRQDNNYYSAIWTHQLTKAGGGYPAGYNESLYMGSLYSMRVLAWTTDAVVTPFPGFSMHALLTLRDPTYSHYLFCPTFSDGVSEEYDFSGKNITSSPTVEIELEPSYEIGRWRTWISARYYGRQYVNITNSLYFNPHWETFGGVDYTLNEHVKFSVSVVNFLNQTGASAGIQAASLASDPTPFRNYLTSGTYLRPFTLEFGLKLKI